MQQHDVWSSWFPYLPVAREKYVYTKLVIVIRHDIDHTNKRRSAEFHGAEATPILDMGKFQLLKPISRILLIWLPTWLSGLLEQKCNMEENGNLEIFWIETHFSLLA